MMTFQQRAIDVIQANGGRITEQRQLLLDLLATAEHDVNAENLYQQAVERDPGISLPTVYRTLHTLEAAHLITSRYISTDHEHKVYRIAGDNDAFRFTCRRCGSVTTFQSDLIRQLKEALVTELGAEVATFCMCAGGLCAACREELKQ